MLVALALAAHVHAKEGRGNASRPGAGTFALAALGSRFVVVRAALGAMVVLRRVPAVVRGAPRHHGSSVVEKPHLLEPARLDELERGVLPGRRANGSCLS
jgi:hypothetical protein